MNEALAKDTIAYLAGFGYGQHEDTDRNNNLGTWDSDFGFWVLDMIDTP